MPNYVAPNRDVIEAYWKLDRKTAIRALRAKLEVQVADDSEDDTEISVHKLMSAGMLACMGDPAGKKYLLETIHHEEKTQSWNVQQAFWVIGHIGWFYPDQHAEIAAKNTAWRGDFMVKMLREPKKIKGYGLYNDRQDLALSEHGGNFARALAVMKHPEAFAILQSLWTDIKGNPDYGNGHEILEAFKILNDPKSHPLLLKALKDSEHVHIRLAFTVREMGIKEAVPILLDRADEYHTYAGLIDFDDPRILPGLKKKLPDLRGKPLGEAKIQIIKREGGDMLPKFMELVKDPNHESGTSLQVEIYKLKDARAIPYAIEQLGVARSAWNYYESLRFLANFKDEPIALKTIIDALSTDFNAIGNRDGKAAFNDNNRTYPPRIAKHLEEMTGEDFGIDQENWLEYFKITHPDH